MPYTFLTNHDSIQVTVLDDGSLVANDTVVDLPDGRRLYIASIDGSVVDPDTGDLLLFASNDPRYMIEMIDVLYPREKALSISLYTGLLVGTRYDGLPVVRSPKPVSYEWEPARRRIAALNAVGEVVRATTSGSQAAA